MDIDPQKVSILQLYKILTGSVLPRPIAWVSTMDVAGSANLAPFSFFNVVSVNPPVLGFSPLLNDQRAEKDTLVNIRRTGEFVVNVVSYQLAEQMNQTSASYRSGVSEFEAAGLTMQSSVAIKPPGVLEAMVRFECALQQVISFGHETLAGNLVLGEIRYIHLHPDVYRDGKVDIAVLDPIGRLAGDFFSTVRDRFAIARPNLPGAVPDEERT
jgi:flavin reductase (DIM6/NTAB) family NADH-FMN oxidoreductase RutF